MKEKCFTLRWPLRLIDPIQMCAPHITPWIDNQNGIGSMLRNTERCRPSIFDGIHSPIHSNDDAPVALWNISTLGGTDLPIAIQRVLESVLLLGKGQKGTGKR
jgi:hypothetical protein